MAVTPKKKDAVAIGFCFVRCNGSMVNLPYLYFAVSGTNRFRARQKNFLQILSYHSTASPEKQMLLAKAPYFVYNRNIEKIPESIIHRE